MSELNDVIAMIRAKNDPAVVQAWADWLRANPDKQSRHNIKPNVLGKVCVLGACLVANPPPPLTGGGGLAFYVRRFLGLNLDDYNIITRANDRGEITFLQFAEMLTS